MAGQPLFCGHGLPSDLQATAFLSCVTPLPPRDAESKALQIIPSFIPLTFRIPQVLSLVASPILGSGKQEWAKQKQNKKSLPSRSLYSGERRQTINNSVECPAWLVVTGARAQERAGQGTGSVAFTTFPGAVSGSGVLRLVSEP